MFDNSRKTSAATERNIKVLGVIFAGGSKAEAAYEADCTMANVNTAIAGTNLASIEAYAYYGRPLPAASRRTAMSLIKFGHRMLSRIDEYNHEEAE